MRISASMIDSWADKAEAKTLLPELVRRLIAATGDLTELAVRGADTSNFGGWDGVVTARAANSWLPVDRSHWEMGCSADVNAKARRDFKTRTEDTPIEQAREIAFVFVSPRIWAGKTAWREEAEAAGHWRMVRAYDADDLATWLENAGSVALWLGEQLGVRGPGVSTVSAAWDTWRKQTAPPITREALMAGRAAQVEHFATAIAHRPSLLSVCADSSEEAVAFVCAQLDAEGLANQSVCVTQPEGWSFVDAHPGLQYLVAANAAVAAARAPCEEQCLIVPSHLGDWALSGAAGRARHDQDIVLARPDAHNFEKALIELGEGTTDADRLSQTCGRSWSVYRRRRASNPAIAKPVWMREATTDCLTAIVLVGAWNESKAGDRACVEAITGRRYEDVERDLMKLARLDDAPVLRIGNIWKAKAPLELLYLFGPALTIDQLDRFFSTAQAVLVKPDPALELEPDKRLMAAVYGRVREESGIVLGAMVDSLIKLRVYAEDNQRHDWMARVDQLIRDLLDGADGERWLSLEGWLRQLSEASPDLFLQLLEASLRRPDAPVRRLFSDHSADDLTDRVYHVHLLWALEILAWSPRHLAKVCGVLAQLTDAPIKGNMSNRPSNSLLSLLRPSWPQTTASAQRRLEVLDRLIARHETVAWELLLAMLPRGTGWASPNAKPRWRDDDAGAPSPSGWAEADVYLPAVGKRVLDAAEGNAERIAQLIERIDAFEDGYRERLLAMIYAATAFPDVQRQQVRDTLRERLSWQFSFNTENAQAMVEARALRELFDILAPDDLVTRHAWLFASSWVDLPDGKQDDFEQTEAQRSASRNQAFTDIFQAREWEGVERLAEHAGSPGLLGWQIAKDEVAEPTMPDWALNFWRRHATAHEALLSGLLHGLPIDRRMALLDAAQSLDEPGLLSRFLLAAPFDRHTWTLLDTLSLEARTAYWARIGPGFVRDEGEDLLFVVDQLVDAGRHRTAFNVLSHHSRHIDSHRLSTILNAISIGFDPEGGQLDGWRIGEALSALRADVHFPRRDLAILEYRYFDALRHGRGQAPVLFAELSNDPAFFMEVLSLATGVDEQVSSATRLHAWSVLHDGRGTPGLEADGTVDRRRFFDWIEGVRQLARERDRADAADSAIGTWLSKCPAEPEGAWPCVVVRELLEDPGSEHIGRGLSIGVMNNRGVHSRAMDAGGAPERLGSAFPGSRRGHVGHIPAHSRNAGRDRQVLRPPRQVARRRHRAVGRGHTMTRLWETIE